MALYLVRRFAALVPTLLSLSLVVFLVVALIPGDPARAILGERASAEALQAERERLGLHLPLPVRYLHFLRDLVRLDLGRSSRSHVPIVEELRASFPATLELTLAAMLLAVVAGVGAGVLAAARRGSLLDASLTVAALLGVSMPIFWLGLMLQIHVPRVAASAGVAGWPTSARLDALLSVKPVTGLLVVDALLAGDRTALASALQHLLVPALTLATVPLAIITRMTRSALLDVLGQDYIRTARAKGLAERAVRFRHALRNALLPILTTIGLQFGSLLGGAVITETVFAWPGVGKWLLDAVLVRDVRAIQGGTLLVATLFILVNVVVDALYAVADPRVRIG